MVFCMDSGVLFSHCLLNGFWCCLVGIAVCFFCFAWFLMLLRRTYDLFAWTPGVFSHCFCEWILVLVRRNCCFFVLCGF